MERAEILLTLRVPHMVGKPGTPAAGSSTEFVIEGIPASSIVRAIHALPAPERSVVEHLIVLGAPLPMFEERFGTKGVPTEATEALMGFFTWCYQNISYPTQELRAQCEEQMRTVASALGKLEAYFPGSDTVAEPPTGSPDTEHMCTSLCWNSASGHHTLTVDTLEPNGDFGSREALAEDIVAAMKASDADERTKVLSGLVDWMPSKTTDQPKDQWDAEHPEAAQVLALAHAGDESLREYLLQAGNRLAGKEAMLRMRGAIRYYSRELPALIEDDDYSEILHHVGHIASEVSAIERVCFASHPDGETVTAPHQPDLDAAAEALFDMLWLYSGYSVTSRGPIGCLHRALREIHPESQKMLASGADVDSVRRRFWPQDESGNPLDPKEATQEPIPWSSGEHERLAHDKMHVPVTECIDQAVCKRSLVEALEHVAIFETERAVREAFRRARSGERLSATGGLWSTHFRVLFERVLERFPPQQAPEFPTVQLDTPEQMLDWLLASERRLVYTDKTRDIAHRAFNAAHQMIGGGLTKELVLLKHTLARKLVGMFEFLDEEQSR